MDNNNQSQLNVVNNEKDSLGKKNLDCLLFNDKNNDVVIELKNVVKKFGDFVANDGINFKVKKGEIHAILGENGAGKSTLVNQIYGLIKPTSGEILVDGQVMHFKDSNDAMACGIGMVHQHFMLIESFTVYENIILGAEPIKNGILDIATAKKKVASLAKEYDFQIDLNARVRDISVSMQQKVEILKILYRDSRILIFDEPTASLTPQEIKEFIKILKDLAAKGKSVIIITHKLKEIKEAADFCTIIRAGKYIDTVNVKDTSEEKLAELMVGRKVALKIDKEDVEKGDIVLQIKNLHAKDYRNVEILKGLDLTIRRGEIIGLAGIDGNGQTELVECITGLRKTSEGKITINNIDITNKNPKFNYDNGVSCIHQDRQRLGLILDYTVEENLILQNYKSKFSSNNILDKDKIRKNAIDCIKKYDIRPEGCEETCVKNLSGGNQQKVIIAREVENNKDLLIAFNPTRGLDVQAIEFIHKYLLEERKKGKAILLISFELEEIMSLSDDIQVIFDGKINTRINAKDATEKELGLLMAGGKR